MSQSFIHICRGSARVPTPWLIGATTGGLPLH